VCLFLPKDFDIGILHVPDLFRNIMSKNKKNIVADSEFSVDLQKKLPKIGIIGYLKSRLLLVVIVIFLALGALGSGLKYLDESAQQEIGRRANNKGFLNNQEQQSFLNKFNPFLPTLTPSPTPQLSKEYIYAGSRLLAVEDANATAASTASLTIWKPTTGDWYIKGSNGASNTYFHWGTIGDIPTPGDFDGDGKADFAIWRPGTGYWWVYRSSDNSYFSLPFGSSSDKPVAADYDGDGKADLATFSPTSCMWWVHRSSDGLNFTPQWGLPGDLTAQGDYNGDGVVEPAVWRDADKSFYVRQWDGTADVKTINVSNAIPVVGDYDGDGKADHALLDQTTLVWYIRQSSDGQMTPQQQWGLSNDMAVPADYDGDGKTDIAVWRPSNYTWYIRNSSNNTISIIQWEASGDLPVPAMYR
jgi:hypothetical protein